MRRLIIATLLLGLATSACYSGARTPEPSVAPERRAAATDPWGDDPTTTPRLGSDDPAATAVAISRARFVDDTARHVVLSRDDAFPDALAGTPLLGEGPLLLTPTASLADSVEAELDRVLPDGGVVYLLGGTAALGQAVEDAVAARGYDTRRLSGQSRFDTAVTIATEVARLYPAAADTVVVARSHGTEDNPTAAWADSVTGGAFAAADRHPVVLSHTGALADVSAAFLDGRARAVLLGGTAALSDQVRADAAALVGRVDRAAGAGRDATAVEIMTDLVGADPGRGDRVALINGYAATGWAFGLPAAGLAADFDAALLPVAADVVPGATAGAVTSSSAVATLAIGGPATIGDAVLADVEARDGSTSPAPTQPTTADGQPPDVPAVGDGIPLRLARVAPRGATVADALATSAVPITVGVPVPVADAGGPWAVTGPDGAVPTQVRQQVALGDGLAWLLVDAVLPRGAPSTGWSLAPVAPPAADPAITVDQSSGNVVVDAGATTWTIPATTDLLAQIAHAGTVVVSGAGFTGSAPVAADVEVVDAGPVRARVELRASEAVEGLDVVARIDVWAGIDRARFTITATNHRPCLTYDEAGGADNGPDDAVEGHKPACNGLRSANRITLDDLSWGVDLDDGAPSAPVTVVHQNSSGTDAWNTYVGREPRMQSGVEFRGFRTTVDGEVVASGDAAAGHLVAAAAGGNEVALDLAWMRERFPTSLRDLGGARLEAGVLAGEFAVDHVLRAGEQTTADVWVSVGDTPAPWGIHATADLDWLARTEAFGPVPNGPISSSGPHGAYDAYLAAQLDDAAFDRDECNSDEEATFGCATSLPDAQVRYDLFGWTDFGDLPTDFEGPMSPYNLKYDANLGFLLQALRSGEQEWWRWAASSSRHYADIDILHTRTRGHEDTRPYWAGGAFGHSFHNEPGIHNPHRNYQNPNPDVTWGVAGMAAWSLLTGDPVTREAAVELADNTLWRFRNTIDTECAAASWGGGTGEGYGLFDDDGRPVANAVRIWLWAWRLTGDTAYLDAIADAVDWHDCSRDARADCPGWRTALVGRALGESWRATGQAGIDLHPGTADAVVDLAEMLQGTLAGDAERAWMVTCDGFEEINAWMLGAADLFAHAAGVSGDQAWLEVARRSFTTGATDPFYEGDTVQYHTAKELVNVVDDGLAYLAFEPA